MINDVNLNYVINLLRVENISDNYLTKYAFNSFKEFYEIEIKVKDYSKINIIIDDKINSILENMKFKSNFKLESNEIKNGICGYLTDKRTKQGVYVLSNIEVTNLNLTDKEKEVLKPFYDKNNIFNFYSIRETNKQILYMSKKYNDIINEYPNIKNHLDKFKEVLTGDNLPYGIHRIRDISNFNSGELSYGIHWVRDISNFNSGEMILSKRMCKNVGLFSYIDFECFFDNNYYGIKTKRINLYYLLGLLNSELILLWLSNNGKKKTNILQIDKHNLLEIPLIITKDLDLEFKLISIVKQIINCKNTNQDLIIEMNKIVKEIYR